MPKTKSRVIAKNAKGTHYLFDADDFRLGKDSEYQIVVAAEGKLSKYQAVPNRDHSARIIKVVGGGFYYVFADGSALPHDFQ